MFTPSRMSSALTPLSMTMVVVAVALAGSFDDERDNRAADGTMARVVGAKIAEGITR